MTVLYEINAVCEDEDPNPIREFSFVKFVSLVFHYLQILLLQSLLLFLFNFI